jgi:hypothetical protein
MAISANGTQINRDLVMRGLTESVSTRRARHLEKQRTASVAE